MDEVSSVDVDGWAEGERRVSGCVAKGSQREEDAISRDAVARMQDTR